MSFGSGFGFATFARWLSADIWCSIARNFAINAWGFELSFHQSMKKSLGLTFLPFFERLTLEMTAASIAVWISARLSPHGSAS